MYCKAAINAATIGTKLFTVAGDISHSYLSRMSGCFFNIDLMTDYELEDPYDLVLNNKWTLDKFLQMQEGLYSDLDNNGIKSRGDMFGTIADGPQIDCTQYSGGIRFCDHDENHLPRLSADVTSERIVKIVDYWIAIFKNGNIVSTDDTWYWDNGHCVFYIYPLAHVTSEAMRNAEFRYGFVPQPKFDENQENYVTSLTNYFSFWCIPKVTPDGELSATLIECMSSEGYHYITPAVFETAYKYKYTDDETLRQAEIFEILRANVYVDFGKICTLSLSSIPSSLYRDVVISGTNNYLSRFASSRRPLENGLKKLIEEITGS